MTPGVAAVATGRNEVCLACAAQVHLVQKMSNSPGLTQQVQFTWATGSI